MVVMLATRDGSGILARPDVNTRTQVVADRRGKVAKRLGTSG
jgi:hypothetical protein